MREQGKDWTGNSVYLWAIANAVYMALLGPQGFREVGELILQRSALRRAAPGRDPGRADPLPARLLQGVRRRLRRYRQDAWPRSTAACASTGSSAARTCRRSCPELGQSALYCVTEMHTTRRHRPAGRGARRRSVVAMTRAARATTPPVWDEPVIMELGHPGRRGHDLSARRAARCARPSATADGPGPDGMRRATPPALPELSEPEVQRHYLHLVAADAGHDGHQPLRHLHDEVQCRGSARRSRAATSAELHPLQAERHAAGHAGRSSTAST